MMPIDRDRNYYEDEPWTKHPPGISYKAENKLNCSMIADWLMKFYYALPNATELASEGKLDAEELAEHLKTVVLESTAEETVDTRPYMKATEEQANKLIEMCQNDKTTPEELKDQLFKLRDTYLENAVNIICSCEKGELPVSDIDQIKKHERVIQSQEPATKKLIKEAFGFDVRHLLKET